MCVCRERSGNSLVDRDLALSSDDDDNDNDGDGGAKDSQSQQQRERVQPAADGSVRLQTSM